MADFPTEVPPVPLNAAPPSMGNTSAKALFCLKCGQRLIEMPSSGIKCVNCDKDFISSFMASTVTDELGRPWKPKSDKLNVALNNLVITCKQCGKGTLVSTKMGIKCSNCHKEDIDALNSQTVKVEKKARKPRTVSEEPKVRKNKAGEISLTLTVEELVKGLDIAVLGQRIIDALDLLPASNIAEMKKVVAIQDAIKKTFNLEEPK